ncbi:tRNA pseudouridine(13) synthase TruD [Alishewanella sp. SMS8]|uniref:tRNA pseudouridine(13) synthase TruD n=1 Tax=Alishewanella sp. SMS8 TaxID=2994676 RepID=UPI002741A0A0|nr:tRNA pseudouridine(13) synthase TruD [Alishewanella sp. SMS8]MDP5458576.1 tRNA pseudouridine(13) synthase TruD [Alishewanella sp. SMS8]
MLNTESALSHPSFPSQAELAYLHGQPHIRAAIRAAAADFLVVEELNFTPSGAGEHILLQVEKTGQNTQFIARELARLTGLRVRDISYAGLKDRHAVTQQWFCFKWPIKQELDWQTWQIEGADILQMVRHYRKLRLGALKRNHFTLRLTQVSDIPALMAKLPLLKAGVPNYYGEQRFGMAGGNLHLAERLFRGESIADRQLRGLALSASRSFLFNQVLSARIQQGHFQQLMAGDVVQLNGSGSIFPVTEPDAVLQQRLYSADIHLTAPLCGEGKALVSADAALFEQQVLAPWQHWVSGLELLRVQVGRRAMRVIPESVSATVEADTVTLQFALPAGCFATSVLRELVSYRDIARDLAQMEC